MQNRRRIAKEVQKYANRSRKRAKEPLYYEEMDQLREQQRLAEIEAGKRREKEIEKEKAQKLAAQCQFMEAMLENIKNTPFSLDKLLALLRTGGNSPEEKEIRKRAREYYLSKPLEKDETQAIRMMTYGILLDQEVFL